MHIKLYCTLSNNITERFDSTKTSESGDKNIYLEVYMCVIKNISKWSCWNSKFQGFKHVFLHAKAQI